MISQNVTLKLKSGLHARPVSQIINHLGEYTSSARIIYAGKTANAKSMISLLTLGVKANSDIEVTMEGSDEKEEMQKFVDFLENLED
ncbi:MAG: HPr family phosphocarrier protein [Defluviitaleaceae bacterium]|nr:HPr family phosphocarrier protein [Defluviitaleaceae bacterium]